MPLLPSLIAIWHLSPQTKWWHLLNLFQMADAWRSMSVVGLTLLQFFFVIVTGVYNVFRPPSGPLWKYRFSYRFFLLKIQVIYRFFNKKYRLKKVPPNSHKDLKLKKKHLMNFCTTIATIKLIWILQSPSERSEQGKNLQFLDSLHHFFGTKK